MVGRRSRTASFSAHRKKRLRRPLPGTLLFQDGSTHRWIATPGASLRPALDGRFRVS
jgi:hypothetical protein